jgi:hypothetical protein
MPQLRRELRISSSRVHHPICPASCKGERLGPAESGKGTPTCVHRRSSEFFLDAEKLIVFRHSITSGRSTGLDLSTIGRNGEISNRRILSLT